MGKGKKPDFPKPKKSQRHGKGAAGGAVSVKQKGGAGAKPQHRKAKVKGKMCSDCGGTVASGAEARHGEGKCTHRQWRGEVAVQMEEPVASVVMTTPEELVASTITTLAPASVIATCEHCKKSMPPGTEGNHFRLKQRVNARPGVMDKKWYCHASPSPKPVAPPPKPKPKPVAASTSTKVGTWFRRGDLWDCPCHMIDISFRDATCPSGCGGIRPPL